MIVMLGCDVGTYRFRCVRRLFNVPPFPPSYRCRLNDGGYSVIFVLCGRIRRLIDTTDAPAGTSLHHASRKTPRRGDWAVVIPAHPFFLDTSAGGLTRRTHLPVRPYIMHRGKRTDAGIGAVVILMHPFFVDTSVSRLTRHSSLNG